MSDAWVHLNVAVIRQERPKAFQVILDTGEIVWLPKSIVADAEDYQAGDRDITLSVQRWFAEKEELDAYES
jgi:hypothetical protein